MATMELAHEMGGAELVGDDFSEAELNQGKGPYGAISEDRILEFIVTDPSEDVLQMYRDDFDSIAFPLDKTISMKAFGRVGIVGHMQIVDGIFSEIRSIMKYQDGLLEHYSRPTYSLINPKSGPYAGLTLAEKHVERIDGARKRIEPENVYPLGTHIHEFELVSSLARQIDERKVRAGLR